MKAQKAKKDSTAAYTKEITLRAQRLYHPPQRTLRMASAVSAVSVLKLFKVPEIMPGLHLEQYFIDQLDHILHIVLVHHFHGGVHVLQRK